MAEEDWRSLLDHTQHLFQALPIPFGLGHLLHHLLAVRHSPAPSETILAKVLVAGQKRSLDAACQQIWDFGMELPLHPCYTSEELVGACHATEVGSIQPGKQST